MASKIVIDISEENVVSFFNVYFRGNFLPPTATSTLKMELQVLSKRW
jgi:hypothetical protein